MTPVGSYILQTVLTLVGVLGLAAVILLFARRMGVGQPAGPIELVGRLPLDGRRAIYLVRVGGQVFVIGASESGLSKLGEVASDAVPQGSLRSHPSFAEALAQVLRRGPESRSEPQEGTGPG